MALDPVTVHRLRLTPLMCDVVLYARQFAPIPEHLCVIQPRCRRTIWGLRSRGICQRKLVIVKHRGEDVDVLTTFGELVREFLHAEAQR